MKHVSLDTNCLARVLLNDVPEQAKKITDLLELNYYFHVSDYVFSEFCFLAEQVYKLDRKSIANSLETIMNIPKINCNQNLFKQVLPLYIQHPALSFIDCCLAVQAQLNNALPLYTFDKKLALQSNGLAKLIK